MKTSHTHGAVIAHAAVTAMVFFLFYSTAAKADQKSEPNFAVSFEEKFLEELNHLANPQNAPGLNGSDFWFFTETLWEKDEHVPQLLWRPVSLTVGAEVRKMLLRRPVRRYLRHHNIWNTGFRDLSEELAVVRDAAQSSLAFWRAMSRWEWAKPDALLNPLLTSFLARFEDAFTWYEARLGIREDDVIKLSLVFEFLPFAEGNILDVKGFFQLSLSDFSAGEKEILTPPSKEHLIARIALQEALKDRYAGDRVAKQAFRILIELSDGGRDELRPDQFALYAFSRAKEGF